MRTFLLRRLGPALLVAPAVWAASAALVLAQSNPVATSPQAKPSGGASTTIAPIGAFSDRTHTGEHAYGHTVQLWRQERRLFGFFLASEGLDGDTPTGLLEAVRWDPRDGTLAFRARLTLGTFHNRRYHGVPSRDVFTFRGTLTPDALVGVLQTANALTPDVPPARKKIRLVRWPQYTQNLLAARTYPEWQEKADVLLRLRGPKWVDEGGARGQDTGFGAQLPRRGADRLRVRAVDEQTVYLEGVTQGKTVWKERFPLRAPVNPGKLYEETQGQNIVLGFEQPYGSAVTVQRFSWDGKRLKHLGTKHKDPSAEAVENAIRAAEAGNRRAVVEVARGEILYPDRHIHVRSIAPALRRGHAAALRLFKAGKARQAADRLALMFDLSVILAEVARGTKLENSAAPDRWLAAWLTLDLKPPDYVLALNEYGYFLQRAGDHRAALPIFENVVRASPERVVARLNLADTLWALGRQTDARLHYHTYQLTMITTGKASKVPPHVVTRLR